MVFVALLHRDCVKLLLRDNEAGMMDGLGGLIAQHRYTDAIRDLDSLIQQHAGPKTQLVILYSNRAWLYHKLDMPRKALKARLTA